MILVYLRLFWILIFLVINLLYFCCREGMKWCKDIKFLKVCVNVVVGEFMNVNEIWLKLIGKIYLWESMKLSLVMGVII